MLFPHDKISFVSVISHHVLQAIREAGVDVNGFLTVGVSAALRQLLEFGLFHGDPHPGNVFAMRDGRIGYVDFGNVAVLSQVKYILPRHLLCGYWSVFLFASFDKERHFAFVLIIGLNAVDRII